MITAAVARDALALLEVDAHGFDEVDRKLLLTIIDKFGGGPVGVAAIAAAISEEPDALEDIYEPYLLQIGFLDRTPRGRMATRRAYEHFGRVPPPAARHRRSCSEPGRAQDPTDAVPLSLRDFDYELPEEAIAQEPLPQRDASRLLRPRPEPGRRCDITCSAICPTSCRRETSWW